MATSFFKISQLGFHQKLQNLTFLHSKCTLRITCGLRNGPRKPMWRTRVLSTEAIQAVQFLKLAKKSSSKVEHVFSSKVSRLLKNDLLDTLTELQRQNELDLTLKVFNFLRKELWYVPDLSLYNSMIMMFGKNKMIEMAEQLFVELRDEGLEPDTRTFTEMIGAYFKVEMINKAMDTYELMKASGYEPDKLTLTVLIRNLEKAGEETLSATIKEECSKYFDYPKKFLEEVERTFNWRMGVLGFDSVWVVLSCPMAQTYTYASHSLDHIAKTKVTEPHMKILECFSISLATFGAEPSFVHTIKQEIVRLIDRQLYKYSRLVL